MLYRGSNYALAAGWQGVVWDSWEDQGGINDGSVGYNGQWICNQAGYYLVIFSSLIQNAQGGQIEVAWGFNSGYYARIPMGNTYYYAQNIQRVFKMAAGGLIQPTLWVSAVGGLGVVLQGGAGGTWTSIQRVA
jgi:hypothetical protein